MAQYSLFALQPYALKILIEMVQHNQNQDSPPLISYGSLSERLQQQFESQETSINPQHIGRIVGTVMDDIWNNYRRTPPINVFVVNQNEGFASKGAGYYAEQWLNQSEGWWQLLNKEQKQKATRQIWEDAKTFNKWDQIKRNDAIDVDIANHVKSRSCYKEFEGKDRRRLGQGPPESSEHRRLKYFIYYNRNYVKITGYPEKSGVEYSFVTRDEADVVFYCSRYFHIIEVKSRISNEEDLKRGVYQCIKYRALGEAEENTKSQYEGCERMVKCDLVVERDKIPKKITALSQKLGVTIYTISKNKVDQSSHPDYP